MMQTADFNYELPPELIAQRPTSPRDQSRLLVLRRESREILHRTFRNVLEFLEPGDALVLNDSRVIPARLRGLNSKSRGRFEILLLEESARNDWWTMMRPAKKAPPETEIILRSGDSSSDELRARVTDTNAEGHRRLLFSGDTNIRDLLDKIGEMPVPPYIKRSNSEDLALDKLRYQTIYAKPEGSMAAPTAGLHFTEELLDEIRARGIHVSFLTLHVGLGTFAPVKATSLQDHVMHEERYELSDETVRVLNETRRNGRRVVAVGTTTLRVLESVAAAQQGRLVPGAGRTHIFIYPPYRFQIVDALLTNFHLPCSTLLMLVSAFASPGDTRGREIILSAYAQAIQEKYRFFSYGDAMLII